jgi:putative NADH-flavin reductase
MNIFLLGATGRTGRLVMDQALSRNHGVTAIIRKPGTIRSRGCSSIIVGDPLSPDVLAPALANQDAVISCLGQRSRQDANLLRDAAAAIVEAMGRARVRRYIVVSQGLLFRNRNPIIALLRLLLTRYVADSAAMEWLVRASDLDWTIVRPPMLKEGQSSRGYRIQSGAAPHGAWAMQRTDLASFLLEEAENGKHKKEIVGITSA